MININEDQYFIYGEGLELKIQLISMIEYFYIRTFLHKSRRGRGNEAGILQHAGSKW